VLEARQTVESGEGDEVCPTHLLVAVADMACTALHDIVCLAVLRPHLCCCISLHAGLPARAVLCAMEWWSRQCSAGCDSGICICTRQLWNGPVHKPLAGAAAVMSEVSSVERDMEAHSGELNGILAALPSALSR
jgi:hypothetical protein